MAVALQAYGIATAWETGSDIHDPVHRRHEMKAILKRIDTNSASAFETLLPDDAGGFGFWLNASIGTDESEGADDFQIFVCNPVWLDSHRVLSVEIPDRHLLVDGTFNAGTVRAKLESFLEGCIGEDWLEIARKVSEIGVWEFEGYTR